jgi:hypothetical protein
MPEGKAFGQKYMDGWEAPTAKSGDYHPEGKIVGVTRGTKKSVSEFISKKCAKKCATTDT